MRDSVAVLYILHSLLIFSYKNLYSTPPTTWLRKIGARGLRLAHKNCGFGARSPYSGSNMSEHLNHGSGGKQPSPIIHDVWVNIAHSPYAMSNRSDIKVG